MNKVLNFNIEKSYSLKHNVNFFKKKILNPGAPIETDLSTCQKVGTGLPVTGSRTVPSWGNSRSFEVSIDKSTTPGTGAAVAAGVAAEF